MAEGRNLVMTNADLFRAVFNGLMATELWAKPESEFLEWLNAEAITKEESLMGYCVTAPTQRPGDKDADRKPCSHN